MCDSMSSLWEMVSVEANDSAGIKSDGESSMNAVNADDKIKCPEAKYLKSSAF